MSLSVSGLTEVGFCDKDTLSTSPVDAIAMGIRNATEMTCEEFGQVELYRGQQGHNLVNRKWEGESYQQTMWFLKKSIDWAKNGCDVQMLSTKQATTADSEDVFPFIGDNRLGYDFELGITKDKRYIKPMLEGATERATHIAFLDAADSVAKVDLGFVNEGKDEDLYRAPWFFAIEAPKSTELVNKWDVVDWKLFLRSLTGKKLQYNISKTEYIQLEAEITIEAASIAEVVAIYNKAMQPSFYMTQKNNAAGTLYDAFDIAATLVTFNVAPFRIGDENRNVVVSLKGDIPINNISFLFGDGNGGDVLDTTGEQGTGGTLVAAA